MKHEQCAGRALHICGKRPALTASAAQTRKEDRPCCGICLFESQPCARKRAVGFLSRLRARRLFMSSPAAAAAAAAAPRPLPDFVTSNQNKLAEVRALLGGDVRSAALDLPELQGSPEAVAAAKCRAAAAALAGPALTEDTSLCFAALGGLPGVYVKWFLEACGPAGLHTLLAGHADKAAYAQCIFAYAPGPGAEPTLFVGRCPGTIVPPAGPADFGWDPIFLPDGHAQTFAQMDKAVKNSISHRAKALALLQAHFQQ